MQTPVGWRHAIADTSNFDRGVVPASGEPAVLDLRALRALTPYGLVGMACLVAHNDRLLAPTVLAAPLHPLAAQEVAEAGLGLVVHEFLCPVDGDLPGCEPAGPAPAGGRGTVPARRGPGGGGRMALALCQLHGEHEEARAVEVLRANLAGRARPDRVELAVRALRLLVDNRRAHSGAFDAFAAGGIVGGGAGEPCIEVAVGDAGMGVLASLTDRAAAGGAPPEGGAASPAGAVAVADDAGAADAVLGARQAGTEGGGSLADLATRVTAAGGVLLVRTGTARHAAFATGISRATVPWVRGTIVTAGIPVGMRVPPSPRPHRSGEHPVHAPARSAR